MYFKLTIENNNSSYYKVTIKNNNNSNYEIIHFIKNDINNINELIDIINKYANSLNNESDTDKESNHPFTGECTQSNTPNTSNTTDTSDNIYFIDYKKLYSDIVDENHKLKHDLYYKDIALNAVNTILEHKSKVIDKLTNTINNIKCIIETEE